MSPSQLHHVHRRAALTRLSGLALAALGGAALTACDWQGQGGFARLEAEDD